jgi:hypothetical protein
VQLQTKIDKECLGTQNKNDKNKKDEKQNEEEEHLFNVRGTFRYKPLKLAFYIKRWQ